MSLKKRKNVPIQQSIKIWPVPNPADKKHHLSPISIEKPFHLPELSNPLSRLKETLNPSQSLDLFSMKKSFPGKFIGTSFRDRRISVINNVIHTCEQEKETKNPILVYEINRSQNELLNVVKSLEKFKQKESPKKRKRENEFYMTRAEMKKMIEELKSVTKHIC